MSAPQIQYPPTSGGGAPVGGSGTSSPSTIPRWTGASTLGDSGITDNGTVIGVANGTRTLLFNLVQVSGNQVNTPGAGELAIQYATSKNTVIYNGSSPALFVNGTSGNVGIGTASPGAILHTLGTGTTTGIFATSSANSLIELRRSTSTTLGYIGTGSLVTGGAAADLAFRCESGNLLFSTVATERARIDSTGNVGIGVIPSAWASSVRAEEMRTHARWNYNSGSDSVAYWTVNAFLNSAGNAIYKATAAASQYTQIGGAHVWERAVSGTAGNTVTWLESARIDSNGNFAVGRVPTAGTIFETQGDQVTFRDAAGNVRFRFEAANSLLNIGIGSGWGLKLPATPGNADTQTLDAYKENTTWAPTVTWGTGGTVTTTSATGAYTQIGNVVTFTVTIAYNCSVIPTGGSITMDLPRTSATGFNQRPGLWAFNAWNGVAGSNFLSIGSASTTATLRVANATGTADIATYLTVTASGALVVTATYIAS